MKQTRTTFVAGLLLASLAIGSARAGTLILGDNFDVVSSGTGFALDTGVNRGITATTTRLQGTAAAGIRYWKTEGGKNNNLHYVTNSVSGQPPGKMFIGYGGAPSNVGFTNNAGGMADFGPALFTSAATPDVPSVYEIQLSMTYNNTNRIGFGIGTTVGIAQTWDFGFELFRDTPDVPVSVQVRVDAASSGTGGDVTALITNNIGAAGEELTFIMRVTDAGAEAGTEFHSRVELALVKGGTTNWFYDTQADVFALPYGWRFDAVNRGLYWYAQGGVGPILVDDLSVTWISGPSRAPITQVWTGGGTDDNWSTPDNWNGVALAAGDLLLFGAPARQNNVNDIPSLLTPAVVFTNGGFQLGGNQLKVFRAITNSGGNNIINLPAIWTSTGAKTWNVASGTELALAGTLAVDVTGDHTLLGGGTLAVSNIFQIGSASTANPAFLLADGRFVLNGPGAQFTTRGGFRIGASAVSAPSVAELVLSNGASMYLTTAGAFCRVGNTANGTINRLIVDSSTLTLTGGEIGVPWSSGATGEVIQVNSAFSDCVVTFNRDGAGVGSYLIRNGTLETRKIVRNYTGGSCAMYFDNAILRTALSAESAFMAALDVAEIQSGGLMLDVTAWDVTLASPFSGAGALTKSGSYDAVLTGSNTYTGNTYVQQGWLVLPTTQTNTAAIQVADGAQFGVIATAPGASLTAASLSIAGSSSTLSFNLGTLPNPTAPLARVGTLSMSGTMTVNVSGGSLAMTTGTITLLKWATLIGSPSFTLGTLPAHINGHLVVNADSVDLVVTGVQGYRWTGAADSNWDLSTINWTYLLDNSASSYSDGFMTEFRDGAVTGVVDLNGAFSPALLVVSNAAQAFIFNGGSITAPVLKKEGTGTLTRTDGTSDVIGQIELNGGSYVADTTADATFGLTLTDTSPGLGTFVKRGAAVLTVNSTNSTYDGAVLVQQGTLRLGTNSVALGSTNGGTTIADGASLDLADIQVPHEPVFVTGAGVDGQGAIVNNGFSGAVQNNLTDVTMTGDTTFGAKTGVRWDIRVRTGTGPGPGLRGNGYNLTKVGGGFLSIGSQRHNYGVGVEVPYWHMNLGDILVQGGTLAIEEATSLDNPEKAVVLMPGTTLNFFGLGPTNPIVRTLSVTNASVTGGGSGHTNILNGPIVMDGAVSIRPNSASLFFNAPLSGNASLTIGANPNPGTVYLNATNTFTGDTTVTNSTLSGNGSIAGNLMMVAGTNSPGMGVGTFTVNGDATLAGTTYMQLSPGQMPNCDTLNVGGTLTFGGNLVVVLAPGAASPQAGDVYPLFSKGGAGAFTAISLPDLSALPGGLSWNTNNLAVDGTLSVKGTVNPPSITTTWVSEGSLIFGGEGGVEAATYYVLSSTNVAAPTEEWLPIATNVFGAGGVFSVTNAINPNTPELFFRLLIP